MLSVPLDLCSTWVDTATNSAVTSIHNGMRVDPLSVHPIESISGYTTSVRCLPYLAAKPSFWVFIGGAWQPKIGAFHRSGVNWGFTKRLTDWMSEAYLTFLDCKAEGWTSKVEASWLLQGYIMFINYVPLQQSNILQMCFLFKNAHRYVTMCVYFSLAGFLHG